VTAEELLDDLRVGLRERALHLANPVAGVVEEIAAHPLALLTALAGTAVAARLGDGLVGAPGAADGETVTETH
jgi:hypothetical protein